MLATIIGGLVGQEHTQAGFDAQKAAINQMIAKLDAVGMPPDQSAAVILSQYKQAGIFTPQLEQQVKDSASQFQQIKTDTAARGMQVQALQQMSGLSRTGLTPDEVAQARQQQLGVQRQNTANQQSIIQNMAARGQQGSGAELAARLGASQNASNTGSEAADQMSAMAAQRALQAIGQTSSMAGQLNQQDFGQAAQKAGAADEMNRFNVNNQMAINQRNVTSGNQAQAANLANAQNISNTNIGQNNQEKYNQLQRQRQNWQDKLQYAQAYSNPLAAYGAAGQGAENAKAQMAAGMGKGIDDSIWNVLGMFYGKAPSKTQGTGQENQGQGPTNENASSQSGGSGGNYYGTNSYGGG